MIGPNHGTIKSTVAATGIETKKTLKKIVFLSWRRFRGPSTYHRWTVPSSGLSNGWYSNRLFYSCEFICPCFRSTYTRHGIQIIQPPVACAGQGGRPSPPKSKVIPLLSGFKKKQNKKKLYFGYFFSILFLFSFIRALFDISKDRVVQKKSLSLLDPVNADEWI